MDSSQYRKIAKSVIDELADYEDNLTSQRVVSAVSPGYLRPLLPDSAPHDPEPFDAIRADVQSKIMPGLTHWQSPHFMAFFPCTNSFEANIAEMYSNAFNGAHFNWICSPAVTELETIVLDWLAKALGLPECYLSGGSTHGGGVLHGSASEAILTVMVAARDKYLAEKTQDLEGEDKEEELWRLRSKLVALGSGGTHSSTKKAAQVCGVRFATVDVHEKDGFGLTGEGLDEKIKELKAKGLHPFYLTATLGTTDVCAVDDFGGIADVVTKHKADGEIWVHLDAAYAGSALLLEEYQHYAKHFEHFESFNFNPHKWMLTTFDCSAVWVKSRKHFIHALSIKPHYLRNEFSDDDLVTDYRDWQIPLGRRFRSLKLWFVMRGFGISGLREHVQRGISLAESMEKKIRTRGDVFEVFTPARFGLVSFRVKGATEAETNERTEALYNKLNASGDVYWTSTMVNGKFAIRVVTSVRTVREEHVERLWGLIVREVEGKAELNGVNGH